MSRTCTLFISLYQIQSDQGHVNEMVAHLSESIALANQKLEKLNSVSMCVCWCAC